VPAWLRCAEIKEQMAKDKAAQMAKNTKAIISPAQAPVSLFESSSSALLMSLHPRAREQVGVGKGRKSMRLRRLVVT
jgi:hypothetical protein